MIVAAAVVGLTVLLASSPSWAQSSPIETEMLDEGWLEAVNFYRATAGLPPVVAEPEWQPALVAHGRYTVLNGEATHYPDPSKPGYTVEGARAAQESALYLTEWGWPAVRHVDAWMNSPFHGSAILRPGLAVTAYGAYRDPLAVPFGAGAGLNVLRGIDSAGFPRSNYPVMWPGEGSTVPTMTTNRLDHSGCPGLGVAGPPLRVFTDPSEGATLTSSRIEHDGTEVAHCGVDHTTWHHPDSSERDTWKPVMRSDGLLLLTPLDPLADGTYEVTVSLGNGETLAWSFSVRPAHEIPGHPEPWVWDADPRVTVEPVDEGFDGRTFAVQWDAAHSAPGYPLEGYEITVGGQTLADAAPDKTTAVVVLDGSGEAAFSIAARRAFTGLVDGPRTTVWVQPPFADVATGHTHQQGIYWSAWKRIAAGFSDGTFKPGASTTRGQMAAFLARALDLPSATLPDYEDVGPDHPHAPAIASLTAAGVATGFPDGTFRPGIPVTRAQMAAFLARGLGLPPATQPSGFHDVPHDSEHSDAIARLAVSGITAGHADETFRPTQPVTRGQMATFMYRARKLIPDRSVMVNR